MPSANASAPIYMYRSWEPAYTTTASHFVYFEYVYTKGVEFWDLNEITQVTCSPSIGTCLDKGTYSLTSAPASRFITIRVADLPNEDSFTVTVNISTAPKSDLTSVTTESHTHYYRYNSPISGHDLTPVLTGSNEPTGNNLSVTFESQRTFLPTHTYPSGHSCYVKKATCDTTQTFNLDGTYTVNLQILNYTQGETLQVYLYRHWRGIDIGADTSTSPPEGTHVSSYSISTLQPGLSPQIADLKSEIGGCSLRITNFDSNFTYFFKRLNSEVSISNNGYVRLLGQSDGTTREDYPSSSRTGYLTKNNVAALFTCVALSTDERLKIEEAARKEAERLEAEEAAKAKAEAEANAKAALSKTTTITCVKGKLTKKVTATNPKCRKGYKKK